MVPDESEVRGGVCSVHSLVSSASLIRRTLLHVDSPSRRLCTFSLSMRLIPHMLLRVL